MSVEPIERSRAEDFLVMLGRKDLLPYVNDKSAFIEITNRYRNSVGVMGMTAQGGGLGTVWTALADTGRVRPIPVVRGVRAELEAAMRIFDVHRCQVVVDIKDERVMRFVKLLGFECESVMEHYFGYGQMAFMFVKFREDLRCHQQPPQYRM